MGQMSIALVGCSSVEYWQRWGQQFCESIQAMRTKPDEVIIASLEPLNAPDFVTNIETKELFWDSWNDAIRHSTTDWVWPVGVDDLFEVDAVENLDESAEVIAVAGRESTGASFVPDPHGFERILEVGFNPMRGSIMLRREVAVALPWRPVKWADWMLWCEIRHHGYRVVFDSQSRMVHVRHAGAISMNSDSEAEAQVNKLKHWLLTVGVKPGAEWPPVLLG
jgi:hypothetical protein